MLYAITLNPHFTINNINVDETTMNSPIPITAHVHQEIAVMNLMVVAESLQKRSVSGR